MNSKDRKMADSKARLWSLKFYLRLYLIIDLTRKVGLLCMKFHTRCNVTWLRRITYFERALNQLFVAVLDGDS